jgi:hypothetical protein
MILIGIIRFYPTYHEKNFPAISFWISLAFQFG